MSLWLLPQKKSHRSKLKLHQEGVNAIFENWTGYPKA